MARKPSRVRGTSFSLAVICAAVLLFTGPSARAQRRGFVMSARVESHPVVRVAPRPEPQHAIAHPVTPLRRSRDRGRPNANGNFANDRNRNANYRNYGNYGCAYGGSVQQLLNPVPPYGFDYQYLNAIDSDLNLKAAIDPATQLALSEASRYGCGGFGGGGYILWDGGGYAVPQQAEEPPDESAPAPQPQVIVVQVPASGQATAAKAASPEAEEEQTPPLPDEGQFILVMRDGSQIKAAAFTRSADTIIYISPDGLRHTIALSDLDTGATLRLNSERGSQLQLSL
jgi:hypothetical protein